MSHILASGHHATRTASDKATANSASELVSAFLSMVESGKRPRSLKYKMADAARGRPVNPLGTYPSVAEQCLDAGASPVDVERPLRVMLAHIQRRFRNTLGCVGMKERIKRVAKEDADSQVALTNLALAGDFATSSEIATADRELREELVEKELLAEELEVRMLGENRLYGEKK